MADEQDVVAEEPSGAATSAPAKTPSKKPAKKPAKKKEAPGTGVVGTEGPVAADTFSLPDETGKVLQAAQDDVQAVSGNPLFFTASEDATGAARFQVLDSNWQVCSQEPAGGTQVDIDSTITFYVVKLDELCP
ncbi:hypothetical protein [Nocardioides plantarum]|uniref:PASTA domain-containing protein n=1 Tax=Nocardioides plantarum TaxID=29299 RepID=A0ABV5KFJ0_9ACTN|nr:hypothetical protein [Nocardioides plantarum]